MTEPHWSDLGYCDLLPDVAHRKDQWASKPGDDFCVNWRLASEADLLIHPATTDPNE